ncbi:MAG: hypothetical protein NTW46_02380 [Candidatus Nealsonbacteria bacterium]|nr:hypothetical protein [Candidatus Nealsonbacteria bacterium]
MPLQPEDIFNILKPYLIPVWEIIKSWWWLPAPFILWPQFKFYWLWWKNDLWYAKKITPILLDIKIPKEVLKPIRAMEMVFNGLWQILYIPPNWWEKWIDGEFQLSYTLEIVCIDGEPHFYIRLPEHARAPAEAMIYAQYPEAQVSLAEDYAKKVPQSIPNKDWNMWGADYKFLKKDPYPIRTYKEFETEHEAKEEKRIDPLSILLEAMAKIKKGEQLWVQMRIKPVTNDEKPWLDEAKKIRDELARRTNKKKNGKSVITEAAEFLLTGTMPEESKKEEKELLPPEMKLTPGEREVITKVEEKMAKPAFDTNIRFIYLGKRDVYFQPNLRLPMSYFGAFSTSDCNTLVPWGGKDGTLTKVPKVWWLIPNFLVPRKLYLRKRQLFRRYVARTAPKFPRAGGTFIMNTEELATIYHFPGKSSASAPSLERIESKRGEAPPGLPTGE